MFIAKILHRSWRLHNTSLFKMFLVLRLEFLKCNNFAWGSTACNDFSSHTKHNSWRTVHTIHAVDGSRNLQVIMFFMYMLIQVGFSDKVFLTLAACKRPLSSVTEDMVPQCGFWLEWSFTHGALEGAGVTVASHVISQVVLLFEWPVAEVTLVFPFIAVTEHMIFQTHRRFKSLLAFSAFKWSVFSVC